MDAQSVMLRKTLRLIEQKSLQLIHKMQGKKILHFLHLGKTGGTALQYALRENLTSAAYAIYLHGHDFVLRDVPQGEGVIFLLRDPVSRFVSGFYSRQRQGQPRYVAPWRPGEKDAFEYFKTPNQLATSLTSSDEQIRRRAEAAMKNIQHVNASYWDWFESEQYFRSRASDVFFVGCQESLAEDFLVLRSRLGLPDTAVLPDDDVQAHRNPKHLDKTLEERAVEKLRHWYRDDYRLLRLCAEVVEHQRLGNAIRLSSRR